MAHSGSTGPSQSDAPDDNLRQACHAGDARAAAELLSRHFKRLLLLARQWTGNDDTAGNAIGELGLVLANPEKLKTYDSSRPWFPWAKACLQNIVVAELRRASRRVNYQLTRPALRELEARGLDQKTVNALESLLGRTFVTAREFLSAVRAAVPEAVRGEMPQRELDLIQRRAATRVVALSEQLSGSLLSDGDSPHVIAEKREVRDILQHCLESLIEPDKAVFVARFLLGWSYPDIAQKVLGTRDPNRASNLYLRRALPAVTECVSRKLSGDLP